MIRYTITRKILPYIEVDVYRIVTNPRITVKSASLETLLEEAEQQGISQKVAAHPDITSAVAALLSSSGDSGSVRLVCGTFFIMAEVRRALGIQADSDPIDLN